jgi:SAM-dependent methyltransferase
VEALLERESELEALAELVDAARAGTGSFVFVAGEAGIGKTSLLRALRSRLADEATARVTGARLLQGEIEDLPFEDASFDIVTGFNSFQYAARPVAALEEARRVVVPGGRVLLLNWAPAELCEASGYLAALGALMPPPPPGAPGPFALSDIDALRALFEQASLDAVAVEDVECVWRYPDESTALAGLMCSGPVVAATEHAGAQAVRAATVGFLEPFRTSSGGYRIANIFRYIIGTPCS